MLGRHYGEFVKVLQAFQAKAITAEQEAAEETSWHGLRLVVAYTPKGPRRKRCCARNPLPPCRLRHRRGLPSCEGQESGQTSRGRKLSDSGAKARLYHEVKEAYLAKIVKVGKRPANPTTQERHF